MQQKQNVDSGKLLSDLKISEPPATHTCRCGLRKRDLETKRRLRSATPDA